MSAFLATAPRWHSSVECSLAKAIWSLRQCFDAIEALPRRDVQRLFAGPGKSDVCRLAWYFDHAKIRALSIEYLHPCHRRNEETAFAIDSDAIGEAELTRRNVMQQREYAPVRAGTVRLNVKSPHDGTGSVVHDERLAVVGQRQTVRERILGVDQRWDLLVWRQIVDARRLARFRWNRTNSGISKIDAAFGIRDEIVWREQRHPGSALGELRDAAVLGASRDSLGRTFRRKEFTVLGQRETIRAIARLPHDGNSSGWIEVVGAVAAKIGEQQAAIGRTDRPFGENETVLNQFRRNTRRQHARNAHRRLRQRRQGAHRKQQQHGCAQTGACRSSGGLWLIGRRSYADQIGARGDRASRCPFGLARRQFAALSEDRAGGSGQRCCLTRLRGPGTKITCIGESHDVTKAEQFAKVDSYFQIVHSPLPSQATSLG